MYTFIEIWNTNKEWDKLTPQQQQQVVSNLIENIRNLDPGDIEVVGFGEQSLSDKYAARYRFWSVWRVADSYDIEAFRRFLQKSGWYRYVDQVNIAGRTQTFGQTLLKNLSEQPMKKT
jgi:hypothetical protein